MLFTVMIPTLEDRAHLFRKLCDNLNAQAVDAGHAGEFEIVSLCDDGKAIVGHKRNQLLAMATGKFAAFVDDDDEISDTYVADIIHAIETYDDLDCVGFYGEVWFTDGFAGHMIHSLTCVGWTEEPGTYYRQPNHLNPIRLDLARQVKFKHINQSEDYFWSMELQSKGLLHTEVFLGHKPLYWYRANTKKVGK